MKDLIVKLAKKLLKFQFYEDAISREDKYDSREGKIVSYTCKKSIYSKENLIFDKYFYLKILGSLTDDFSLKQYSIEYHDERYICEKLIDKLKVYIDKRVNSSSLKTFRIESDYLTIFKFSVLGNLYEARGRSKDSLTCKVKALHESYKLIKEIENEYTKKSKE